MFTVLLHSSKTMRRPSEPSHAYQAPMLLNKSIELADYLRTLTDEQIQKSMQLSPAMATKTHELLKSWNATHTMQLPAIDAFLGDIYSGLQVHTFSADDREYANKSLYILSGLYGVLKACDSIYPYRLEMGYKLPDEPFENLYTFWDRSIANVLPAKGSIINLSAVEYTKAVLPHLKDRHIISPKFMTINPKTGEPKFVTVHAKIARGAFAHWIIKNKIESVEKLAEFNELNYKYDSALSTDAEPVFVCEEFGGLGLSVRLT